MNNIRLHSLFLLAAALALAPAAYADNDSSTTTVGFSDPTKPGTLKIRVLHGDVTVRGEDVKEISVKSDTEDTSPTPRKDGMRVLSASASFRLTEKDNVTTLDYGTDGWRGQSANFDITVPKSTSIIVTSSIGGDFECSDVSGDIDVKTSHGDVKLDGVSGGALVETINGEIKVNVKALAPSRPMSFTSMNGQVTIVVPQDLKASVRFRTHRGVILSNFDDKALVTKTEISKRESMHMINVSPDAPPHPDGPDTTPVAPVAPKASKSESDDDLHGEIREEVREATQDALEAARDAAEAAREGLEEAHIELSGNMISLPPMTGGKTVTGNLNGGGVEIQASTLNGDIILKKAD
jgi:hypothetical protein